MSAGPATEPPVEARMPEPESAVLDLKPPSGTPKTEPAPAGTALEPPVEARASETAPSVPAPNPPAIVAPKPPVKPRLLPARGKPTAAAPGAEPPDNLADAARREPGPTSWLGKLADLVRSAEPPRQPRRLERQPNR